MKEDCYLKDPKTGKFMGSKPGCSHGGGEVSDELSKRLENEKAITKQRVDAAAALGNLKPKDSELKDKAERLASEVNKANLSFQEGLYQLSKGNAPFNRYAKAVDLLDRDPSYWRDIFSKVGLDTLLNSFTGVPVPGVSDYVMRLADAKSDVQQINDQKPGLPSGKTPAQVKDEHDKWREDIKNVALDYNKDYKDKYTDDKYTKYDGNKMDTNATFYNLPNRATASGAKYDKYAFAGAMQPIDVGKIPYNKKDASVYVYARVTNIVIGKDGKEKEGKSVIIKINDRGPYTPIVTDRYIGSDGKEKVKTKNMPDPTKAVDLTVAAYAAITDKDEAGKLHVKVEFLSKSQGQVKYEQQMKETDKNENKKRVDKISTIFKLD
ncbi:MAG: septal ring lytic transglycosylase RlpA family protein [Nitrospirota bacterium]